MIRIPLSKNGGTLIELQIAAVISLIVGGISFFTLIRSQSAFNLGEKMTDLQLRGRQSMDRLVEDIRLAGYGLNFGDTAFTSATQNELTMLADINDDGNADTVRYYLGDSTSQPGTPNPNDAILYKSINGSDPGIRIGSSFTSITFGYFDESKNNLFNYGGPTPTVTTDSLNLIRLITINLIAEMQKPDADGHYRNFVLNSSLNPRNIVILAKN
jgi:Tfp pilus assembly protein PilW